MDKKLLLEKYIKVAIKKALKEEEQKHQNADKAMYLIHRFPGLKKSVESLMSPSFGRFISGVSVVAPKPATFRVTLINGYDFNIIYLKKDSYLAKIAGKKYYLNNIGESERATQSIADLLDLSPSVKEESSSLPSDNAPEKSSDMSVKPTPEETSKGNELAADLASEPITTPEEETKSKEEETT